LEIIKHIHKLLIVKEHPFANVLVFKRQSLTFVGGNVLLNVAHNQ